MHLLIFNSSIHPSIRSFIHQFHRHSLSTSCESPVLLTPCSSPHPPGQSDEGKVPTDLDVGSSEKRNLGAGWAGGRWLQGSSELVSQPGCCMELHGLRRLGKSHGCPPTPTPHGWVWTATLPEAQGLSRLRWSPKASELPLNPKPAEQGASLTWLRLPLLPLTALPSIMYICCDFSEGSESLMASFQLPLVRALEGGEPGAHLRCAAHFLRLLTQATFFIF